MSFLLSSLPFLSPLYTSLEQLSPAQWCQAFFVLSSATILAPQALPARTRAYLLTYGARGSGGGAVGKGHSEKEKRSGGHRARDGDDDGSPVAAAGLLRRMVATVEKVPHWWFMHFYICSVACSALWAWQYAVGGEVMRYIGRPQVGAGTDGDGVVPVVDIAQTALAWGMITLQGLRRLYESVFVMNASQSKMLSLHWLVGLAFYFFVNLSVWIEGSGSLQNGISEDDLAMLFTKPKTVVAVAIYAVGYIQQHKAHKHLASLKKYTLPHQGWFKHVVCAHYTAECLIYLGIAIGAAPEGQVVNTTLFTALLFVAVNLGTTGVGTKKWYAEKFGADAVSQKSIMIPGIF